MARISGRIADIELLAQAGTTMVGGDIRSAAPASPMTAARIREAAEILKVTYLPLMADFGQDPYTRTDLAEVLAAMLLHQAAAVASLEADGYRDRQLGQPDLVVPELRALAELIEAAS